MISDRPLSGINVLDFSRVLAGPYCTALLADLGADIIKVEPPGGDDYRHIGPFTSDVSALFVSVNRGKRSIVLDLAQSTDVATAHALAQRADVLVENFRPGVADKLGIGWDSLSAMNPRLVYASISGFGQDGPFARRPAYDIIIQAMSGIMTVTGEADGPPTLIGESIADAAAGLFGSWAILAALVERGRTGRGKRIDVAMLDTMIALQPNVVARYLATGTAPKRTGNRHPLSAPFGSFRARDGMFVLAVLNEKLFAQLASCIGRPELVDDLRFTTDSNRLRHEADLRAVIESWSGNRSARDVVSALITAGIPAAEIEDIDAALKSTHSISRKPYQSMIHPTLGHINVPEQPARFLGSQRGGLPPAPELDEHHEEILNELRKGS